MGHLSDDPTASFRLAVHPVITWHETRIDAHLHDEGLIATCQPLRHLRSMRRKAAIMADHD